MFEVRLSIEQIGDAKGRGLHREASDRVAVREASATVQARRRCHDEARERRRSPQEARCRTGPPPARPVRQNVAECRQANPTPNCASGAEREHHQRHREDYSSGVMWPRISRKTNVSAAAL